MSTNGLEDTRKVNIFVANVQGRCNTNSIDENKLLIEEAANTLAGNMEQQGIEWGVLVAPEYFWGREIMSESDFLDVVGWLNQLSLIYPMILFLPGTVLWEKDIRTAKVSELKKLIDNIPDGKCNPPMDKEARKALININNKAVRNTALGAYHTYNKVNNLQQKFFLYDKQSDSYELPLDTVDKVFLPGCRNGMINWNIASDNTIVLNICIEIGLDTTGTTTNTTTNSNKLGIHIIMSDTIIPQIDYINNITSQHYHIHTSSIYNIYNKKTKKTTPIVVPVDAENIPTTSNVSMSANKVSRNITIPKVAYVVMDIQY